MKKGLSILGGMLVVVMGFWVLGIIMITQAAPPPQNSQSQSKPIPATNINLVKKTLLAPEIGNPKGKPSSPPGQDKKKNGPKEEAATGVLGEPLPQGAKKYAVVIGICDYPGTRNDICLSDGDALNMFEALTTLYGYDATNIHLLRDNEATYESILAAVNDIKSKEVAGDEVVFFFSGHGADGIAQDNDNERKDESIVTHNGTDLVFIWDGQLKDWFSDFDTSRIAFVFDSCLAGGMNDVGAAGRVVVMGTSENQVGYVYSKGENGEGVFTHYFVNQGMLQGLADKYYENGNHYGQVVVEEAFDYAQGIIPEIYKRQQPVISDYFTNDLLL